MNEDLKNAVQTVLDFMDKCEGGTSYLITPDGKWLTSDWGYVYDGLEKLKKWMGGDHVDPSER